MSSPWGLIAALLAGAWDEEIEGDKAALERLAGEKYEALAGELAHLVSVLDKPLRKAGAVWKVASPRDAWFRIGRHISSEDLARFETQSLVPMDMIFQGMSMSLFQAKQQ